MMVNFYHKQLGYNQGSGLETITGLSQFETVGLDGSSPEKKREFLKARKREDLVAFVCL